MLAVWNPALREVVLAAGAVVPAELELPGAAVAEPDPETDPETEPESARERGFR